MEIILSGGTGFIGTHLLRHFSNKPYQITLVTRSRSDLPYSHVKQVTWEEIEQQPQQLEKHDAWINLAGASINQRWNPEAREKILQSRISTTRNVAQCIGQLHQPPKVMINGSAIGIYGHSLSKTFDETTELPDPDDFLAMVVQDWEKESRFIPAQRVIQLRTGLVLGKDGGALPPMLLPFRLGLGGRIGSGKQWMSWIHIDDLVRLIEHCIVNTEMSGAVNATAPQPVRNEEFTKALAKAMNRPHLTLVPGILLRLIFGEMAGLLLKGQRVLPKKALRHHFSFNYPRIDNALESLV